MKYYTVFGQAYGESAYGSSTYACAPNDTACIQGAGTGTGNGSGLADTGIALIGFASLACLIIFIALAVRIWRRPSVLATQEQEVEAPVPEISQDDRPQPLQ